MRVAYNEGEKHTCPCGKDENEDLLVSVELVDQLLPLLPELLKYGRSLLPELGSAHPAEGICDF